jgi:hypothetical protein
MDIRFLRPEQTEGGWLNVRFEYGGTAEIVEYTRIDFYGSVVEGNTVRDKGKILEGYYKDRIFTVSRDGDGKRSRFEKVARGMYKGGANVLYHNTDHDITINGITLQTPTAKMNFDGGDGRGVNSWLPTGRYNLRIPTLPQRNVAVSGFNKGSVWFLVAQEGRNTMTDRFLHPGSVSYGCVTVLVSRAAADWKRIYDHLIISRLSALSVGTLHVVGSETER